MVPRPLPEVSPKLLANEWLGPIPHGKRRGEGDIIIVYYDDIIIVCYDDDIPLAAVVATGDRPQPLIHQQLRTHLRQRSRYHRCVSYVLL